MPLPPLSEVAHVHGSSGRHRASGSTRPRPRLAMAGAVTTLTAVAMAVTVTTVGGDDARTGSAQAASRVAASVPAAAPVAPVALAPAAVAPAPAEDTSSLLARRSSRLDRADRSVRTVAVPRALYRAATTPSTVTVPAAIAAPPAAPAAATPAKPAIAVHYRVRRDKVDTGGVITIRYDSQLRHIGLGRTYARTRVILLVQDLDVRVINAATGELLRELTINPALDYQPRTPK